MKTHFKTQIALVLLLSLSVSFVHAKDLSAQQAGVEYARQEVEKSQVQHKLNLKEVDDAVKLLEQRKKEYEQQARQLANDRKNAELSKQRLQEANAKFTKAQALLDQAWKE
jgi:hypothetical protein